MIQEGHTGPEGSGGCVQLPDGSWTAWVNVGGGNGFQGYGSTEKVALQALEAKLTAFGQVCSAAYAHAEASYRARTLKEQEKAINEIRKSLGLGPAGEDPKDSDPKAGAN